MMGPIAAFSAPLLPIVSVAEDPFAAISAPLPAGAAAACGVAHMRGMREAMEDAFAAVVIPDSPFLFLAVFDGHGGRGTADFAAARLLPCLLATREWAAAAAAGFDDDAALAGALRAGFAACDAAAYESRACDDRSGACALVALVSARSIIVANCGDCRAVLARGAVADGAAAASATALSTDHKPDAHAERARLKSRAGAAANRGGYFQGLAVSRALGDFRTKLDHQRVAAAAPPPLLPAAQQTVTSDPEVTVAPRGAGAALLVLACDGVWDAMSSAEAANFVRAARARGAAPEAVAAALIHECLERGSSDNMTAIVADLGFAPY